MKNLGIFAILSFLFVLGSAHAVELDFTPEKHIVRQGETASYTFTVKSNYDGVYLLSTIASNAGWISMPSSVTVNGGSGTFRMSIHAPRNALPTTHGFPITVRLNSDKISDSVTETVYMTVKNKDGILIESIAPEFPNYRAGETITLTVSLKSDEPLNRDVDIIFDIKNPDGTLLRSTTLRTIIPFDSQVSYDQPFDFGQLSPGKYLVRVSVERNGYVYDSKEGSFEVSPLVNLLKTKETSWTFLAIKNVIRIQNTGNAPTENVEVKDSVPLLWSYFTKEDAASAQASGSEVSYTWRVASVDPSKTAEVQYQIVLWPIYLIVLALGAAGFKGYSSFLMPSISKNFSSRVNLGEGKEASVVVHAKNKGFMTLHDVSIEDSIPASFKIVDASVPRPKYRKTTRGSELKWHLGSLAPGEERVFSYRIKNMMGIIGRVELPSAHMRAGNKSYKSNRLRTSGDKHKQEI